MPQISKLGPPAFVWIDLEMTGLNPDSDHIIEIATLITDEDLNVLAQGPELVIKQTRERMDMMDEWNKSHHSASGLLQKVLQSETSIEQADELTSNFILKHLPPNTAPLCGNSIWQDRRFIEKEMPLTAQALHYRTIDVSTLKELARRWYPNIPRLKKAATHRALDDIKASIEELKYYRNKILIKP